jgi:hypothetical protein
VTGHQPLELLAALLAATSGMMQQRVRFAPAHIAIAWASVTSCAVIAAFIDQPTTRAGNRATTVAT